MKRRIRIALCLVAMLTGLITVPARSASGTDTGFKAGYGMGDFTPVYTVTEIPVSSTAAKAQSGDNDLGTVSLKVVQDRLIFGSYGTADARMGQNYAGTKSYDAAGKKIEKKSYFTYQNGQAVDYQWVDSDMYATCIALQNGSEAPMLLLALDLPGVPESFVTQIRELICQHVQEQTGMELDPDRIMISASHTHSAPDADSTDANTSVWRENVFFPAVLEAALESLQDLTQAQMQVGTVTADDQSHNYTGSNIHDELQYMSSVRHYKYLIYECTACGKSYSDYNYADGYKELTTCPVCSAKNTRKLVVRYYGDSFYTRSEGIAAPYYMQMPAEETYQDMHLVKFTRGSKQDIVLINWRAHPHRTGGEDEAVFSSDLVGGFRDALSGVRGADGTYTGISDSEKPYLVSYYQGAAGNINETSHDRASNGSNNSFGTTVPSDMTGTEYSENYYGSNQSEHYTSTYYQQGYQLALIAQFGLESCMDTDITEGSVQSIHTSFTSGSAELSIQIEQLREAGYTEEEFELYGMLYDIILDMRAIWAERYDTSKYANIQACRRAVIAADPTHTLNGIYQANKIYTILHPYANNGVFDKSAYNSFMSASRYATEEINTIVIGSDLAIVTAPHELFDNTSVQIESQQESFGLKKILTFGYSNGANGYLPNKEVWMYTTVDANGNPVTYSPYEANVCNYQIGTAEAIVESYESMLADLTAQETTGGHSNHCACKGSTHFYHNTGHECSLDAWQAMPTSGSLSMTHGSKYYLTQNVTLDSLQIQNPATGSGTKAMICLNGFTLTVKNSTINVHSGEILALCDCSAKQTGVLQNSHASSRVLQIETGGTLLHYGGTISGASKHQVYLNKGNVYMFGGTVTDGKTTQSTYSANVTMTGGEFWQYGGVIQNGQSNCKPWSQETLDNKEKIIGAGGNLYLSGGNYYQYGGKIQDGTAALSGGNVYMAGGNFYQRGGTISGGRALPQEAGFSKNQPGAGGNLYVGGGKFYQYGLICDGQATGYGGNVYVNSTKILQTDGSYKTTTAEYFLYENGTVRGGKTAGTAITVPQEAAALDASLSHAAVSNGGNVAGYSGTLWMYGGIVEDGQAAYGGNVYAYGATCRIGGTVTGGNASAYGNNVYFRGSGKVLNLAGCSITDPVGDAPQNVYVSAAGTLKLIENCRITGGEYAIVVKGVQDDGSGNGIWLDHCPVLEGTLADIGLGQDAFLSVYENFDYLSFTGDSRICIANVDGEGTFKFARKANTLIQLNHIQDCFVGPNGEIYADGGIRKILEDPSDIQKQWLALCPYTVTVDDGSDRLFSLQGAADYVAANGGTVKLLQDLDMGSTKLVHKNGGTLIIDLNGCDLTCDFTLSSDSKVACVDTTLVSYEDSDAHGRLYTNSQIEPNVQHTDGTKIRSFLRLPEAANAQGVPGYSFHRIYMNVSKLSVAPVLTNISASGVFLADRQVVEALNRQGNSHGFCVSLTLNGETVIGRTYIPVDSQLQAGPYEDLSDLTAYTAKQTVLTALLSREDLKLFTVDERANMQIHISTAVKLDGQVVCPGNETDFTFKSMVKKMNAGLENANAYLRSAFINMYGTYQQTMETWDDETVGQIRTAYEAFMAQQPEQEPET